MDQLTEGTAFLKALEHNRKPQDLPQPKGRERFRRDVKNLDVLPRSTLRLAMLGSLILSSFLGHVASDLSKESTVGVRILSQGASSTQISVEDRSKIQSNKTEPIISSYSSFEKQIFANFSASERKIAEQAISKELENYQYDTLRIENTLQWENMIDQIIQDSRLKIPKEDREFWKHRMLQIIFVESEGDSFADPANKITDQQEREKAKLTSAKGLTQILPSTAREVAGQYQVYDYDLTNGWNNIFLGLAYQLNMARKYGTEIAAWTHHLGPFNMNVALATYLIQVKELPIDQIKKDIIETPNNDEIILKYIKDCNINPVALLTSPAVTAKLKEIDAYNNDTEFYWHRLIAAERAMKQ